MSEELDSIKQDEKTILEYPPVVSSNEFSENDISDEMLNDPAFAPILARLFRKHVSRDELETSSKSEQSSFLNETQSAEQQQENDAEQGEHLSNRKRKQINRMTVAALKQMVKRPEVVDLHDPNSKDARLLVYLKSYRNTVPVPGHWILKRKYLSTKKGIEKSRYVLPSYIESTGVAVQRDAYLAEEAKKSRKQKQREKIRPRMGKVSLDLQELHDAFFIHQTKPENMSIHGDIYYEGKEYEINKSKFKPGHISAQLREALDMAPLNSSSSVGNAAIQPPPWLYNMQRYGPPPSYPNLRIPGVNAPIPERLGAQYGLQNNQWGRPPVDEVCFFIISLMISLYLNISLTILTLFLFLLFVIIEWESTVW